MKRVKTACIQQTLVFAQKEDCGFGREQILSQPLQEQPGTEPHPLPDRQRRRTGRRTIVVRVRKQYNDRADVAEYFQ